MAQSFSFTPNTPMQGPQAFDFSGIQSGIQGLQNQPGYSPTQSNSYSFTNPDMNPVASRRIVGGPNVTGRMRSPGAYGQSSRDSILGAYESGFGSAAAPIRAQGKERMRAMSQGFEGGRMSSGVQRGLAMENAQKTGEDLRDVSRSMGSGIMNTMLQEGQTARSRDYDTNLGIEQDYQNQLRARDTGAYAERTASAAEDRNDAAAIRDAQYQTAVGNQQRQADEDYRYAGFTDAQARYQSDQGMQRAMNILNAGFALPQLQDQLYGTMLSGWDRMMGMNASPQGAGG